MANLDPISSNIGHGTYGLRSNLRPFSELTGYTNSQKHAFVELRGSVVISGTWVVHVGSIYKIAAWAGPGTFNGKTMAVVGVRTTQETLKRREDVTDWSGLVGLWYYDGAGTIYIKLTNASTDPNTLTIVADVGFYFSNVAVTLPNFGTEKLTDGGFETWTSATQLTNWTNDHSGAGMSLARESSDIKEGTYSAQLVSTGAATGRASIYVSTTASNTGYAYCVYGWYKTPATQSANLTVSVVISDGAADTNVVQSDGRTYLTGTLPTLTPTLGEWRRFEFYYLGLGVTTRIRLRLDAVSSAGAGSVYFDDVHWQPVPEWNLYEPRVRDINQFAKRESRQDIYWGSWTVGVGAFELLNSGPAPGYFEELAGRFNLINAAVTVRLGGRFPDGGEEIAPSGLFTIWTARTKRPEISDGVAKFPMRDIRDLLLAKLPPNTYSTETLAGLDTAMDGALRPLSFVEGLYHVKAARVSTTGNGYGIYELVDVTSAPNGMHDPTALRAGVQGYAYLDDETAAVATSTKRVAIGDSTYAGGTDVSFDLTNGRVSVLRDVRVYDTRRKKYIDFTRNGTTYKGSVGGASSPVLTIAGIVTALQTSMRAASGSAALTVTYSESTHKVTIADASAATLTLLTNTGLNTGEQALGPIMGYDPGTDKTGALSYAAGDAIFADPDSDHHIRFYSAAYRDDASGTYTGGASGAITIAVDALRALMVSWLNLDGAIIDSTTFNAFRSGDTNHQIYLGSMDGQTPTDSSLTARAVIERVEVALNADLRLENGRFYLRARSDSVPTNVVDVYDADILQDSFSSWFDDGDLFEYVRVNFGLDPSEGTRQSRSSGLSRVLLKYGRADTKVFETFLGNDGGASTPVPSTLRTSLATLAETPKRRFKLSVKGKVFTLFVGDTFRLNRTRRITDSTGSVASGTLVRIFDKLDRADFVSEVLAVEV